MQLLETLFVTLLALAIIKILVGPTWPRLRYSTIAGAAAAVLVLGLLVDGWRWQLLPAYVGFSFIALGCLKKSEAALMWRVSAAVPLLLLVAVAALLAQGMPIVELPAPTGPYAVGTFDYSITDPDRVERYAPQHKRELHVEVWYPADKSSAQDYPLQALFHDLYAGTYNQTSFLFGYLERVNTHSHVEAPIAQVAGEKFPVLLFNHALDFGFSSQNLLLMEQLASHGYVVFSIAHPYQTAKVNLDNAGTVFRAADMPDDLVLPREELEAGIVGAVFAATADIHKVSQLKSLLLPYAEDFLALPEEHRSDFLQLLINSPEMQPFTAYATEDLLADFFYYDYQADNSLMQYWVDDNVFIADTLLQVQAPVPGFIAALDPERLGVLGMSNGGAAAGEFCKIDRRCKAGINLDGTQFGSHWNSKLPVPFLMFYNDEHQGGNDYAYLPPVADFWDYRVKGSSHMDFSDFVYLWPALKLIGFSGSVEGMRMMHIINTVQLDFLDHYLKGKTIDPELHANMPELVIRSH